MSRLIATTTLSIIIIVGLGAATINTTPAVVKSALAQQMQMQNTNSNNNTTPSSTSNTTGAKPVDGYDKPEGHVTAIRHVFDDSSLRVQHYCKPNDKILLVCQLYDTNSPNGTLIGIEYIISADQYNSLPNREKPGWHYHKIEFATNRADARFPDLSIQKAGESLQKLSDTYGKVIITWNPNDKTPIFPPQVIQVQHPFMVNTTVSPETETQAGTFNQTLE